jgi:hypothetical protein
MRIIFKAVLPVLLAGWFSHRVMAGNIDRAGQAGASHLLINPWARSSGWHTAGTANTQGLEATFANVAGLAFAPRTEILVAHTRWLIGSDVTINAFGLAQRLGKNGGVLGLAVTSLNYGNILITNENNPEGTGGYFSPRFLNVGLSYARSFSDKIHGGVTFRVINEAIANVSAAGFAIDAGVQYVTNLGAGELKKENFVFGITLRNIGPRMRYNGDGLSTSATLPTGATLTAQQRSSDFEMPALLNVGVMYRWRFNMANKLTFAGAFQSNSFTRDQVILGLEYSWKDILMLRGGYAYERGIMTRDRGALNSNLLNAFTGPAAGATVNIPLGKSEQEKKFKPRFGLDYSFRATYAFGGTHTFGARLAL